jgi:hypothetical protein
MTAALFGLALPATAADSPEPRDSAAVMTREFIFDHSQFASCHASTIAQTPSGLVAAWFGGPEEGDPQVGIWLSRHDGRHWSQPEEVARGTEGDRRYPCWNPILWQASGGPLLLFYKAGPNPKSWWGMLAESSDAGKHWSQLTWPRLMNDRLSIGGQVKYQDFTQINFFGIGNTSLKSDQTDYRLKDIDALGFVTVSPISWLSVTGRAGTLRRLATLLGVSHVTSPLTFPTSSIPIQACPTEVETPAS